MNLLRSIQVKTAILLIFVGSISFVISLFSYKNLSDFLNETTKLIENQSTVNHITQELILALEEANSTIRAGLDIENYDEIGSLRSAESKFSASSLRFEMFTNSLVWGSESEAFQKADGGIIYSEWVRLGLDKSLIVTSLDPKLSQDIGQIDLFFGSFTIHAQSMFALKRRTLRVSGEEKVKTEEEIAAHMRELRAVRLKIIDLATELTKNMSEDSKKTVLKQRKESELLVLLSISLGIVGFLVNVIGAILFLRFFLIKPILSLTQTAKKISQGDLNLKATVTSKDEIGQLANSFNEMTGKLRDYQEDLEEKVKARTSELERMNNLMLGRELKMVELKREIAQIKNKVGLEKKK